jgi:solute carrier family 25 carnitine/acylcarnitine transporter 20/29
MDNLRRRVHEIEALIAIFGEDNIELEDADAYADVVRALEANDGACSTTTAFCIKCKVTDDDLDDGPDGDGHAKARARCVVSLKLPSDYPDACLEVVSIMSDDLRREDVAALLSTARRGTAAARGEECAFQTLTDITEGFKSHLATMRANAGSNDDVEDEEEFHAMVKIDHMNDSKAYLATLKKWADALGLGVRVFHKSQSIGKRIEGVFVALWGSNEGIKTFLTRLRTELVDVDARGARCKERQSTVLCHRSSNTVKVGEQAVEIFQGFVVEEPYEDEVALEGQLARLNLLHVGDGSQRFVSL